MTMPFLPPVRDQAELENASHCILHWRARDLSVDGVGGQLGAFSRGTSGTIEDPVFAAFTTGAQQPNFEPRLWGIIGYTPMTLRVGPTDILNWEAAWRPKAFAWYLEFLFTAMPVGALWSISNEAISGARFFLDANDGRYRVQHHNGTTAVAATLSSTPPATDDRVELYGYCSASGQVSLYQRINGGEATNAVNTATLTPASTWGGGTARARLTALGTTSGVSGGHRFRTFKLVAGAPTYDQIVSAF